MYASVAALIHISVVSEIDVASLSNFAYNFSLIDACFSCIIFVTCFLLGTL